MFASKQAPDDVFIFNQVKALIAMGTPVSVIQPVPWVPKVLAWVPKWKAYYDLRKERSWGGIAALRCAYLQPPTFLFRPLGSLFLSLALYRAVKKIALGRDRILLHGHAVTPDGCAVLILSRVLRCPAVVSARGSDVHTYPYEHTLTRILTQWTLSRSDRVLAVSHSTAHDSKMLLRKQREISVIYNGVDSDCFHPSEDRLGLRKSLGLSVDAKILLYVGSLIHEKGLSELMLAFEAIAQECSNLNLVILGRGPLQQVLEEFAMRLGGDRVILRGAVPNSTVAHFMQAVDALVHPSHAEGLPNVVLEAMATGLPVVATSVGGIPEIIVNNKTGILVQAKNHKSLAQGLRQLVYNWEDSRSIGAQARAYVSLHHSWDTNARRHLTIYKELMVER
jgi:teichuronic acid biosynthesis glycosyltransferase TuaC